MPLTPKKQPPYYNINNKSLHTLKMTINQLNSELEMNYIIFTNTIGKITSVERVSLGRMKIFFEEEILPENYTLTGFGNYEGTNTRHALLGSTLGYYTIYRETDQTIIIETLDTAWQLSDLWDIMGIGTIELTIEIYI